MTAGSMNKREAFLELFAEPVVIAFTFKDGDGRPLAEMSATKAAKEGVDFEVRRCPYHGSREGKDMNVGALKQLTAQWPNMLEDTVRMRDLYLARVGREAFDIHHFWRFARSVTALPVYLNRRAENPVPESDIPSRISAFFKAGQGLHLTGERLIFEGHEPDKDMSVDVFLEFAEQGDLYLSFDKKRACSGPPGMIEEFVQIAIGGDPKRRRVDTWLEDAVGDFDACLAYGEAVTDLVLARAWQEAVERQRLAQLAEALDDEGFSAVVQKSTRRFGQLREADPDRIAKVKSAVAAMMLEDKAEDDPGRAALVAGLENSADGAASNQLGELRRIVRPLHAAIDEAKLDRALEALLEATTRERRIFTLLEALQGRVHDALGRPHTDLHLESRDLAGTGYTVRENVCKWLKVPVENVSEGLRVKAGSSTVVLAAG